MVKIYSLKDPITNEIRYIGKTTGKLRDRWYSHCSSYKLEKEKSYKNSWIISLKRKGYRPEIELIEEVSQENWEFWERYWISQFLSWGYNLTNMTKGGEGNIGGKGSLGYKHTEEAKRRISLKNSREKSLEWKQKVKTSVRKTLATPIVQYDLEKNKIRSFESFYEACEVININGNKNSTKKNIHACCNGKRKTAYGFIWEYEKV